jgi:NADH:ubiquinone oxidoreductase subunit E
MKTIVVCTNFRPFTHQPSCAQRGSKELADWLEQEIAGRNLDAKVDRSVCLGHCPMGPNIRLLGEDFFHESTRESLIPLLDSLDSR